MQDLAEGCMPFMYFLEDIRTPFFDWFFALITHIADESVFLLIAIGFYWCINKREGYYILVTALIGTSINQITKLFFRVPRPWVLDPNYQIVDAAKDRALGYSFPSGHTQNITGTFGAMAAYNPKKIKTVFFSIIIVLVAFSRMYLGVHTPLDVIPAVIFMIGLVLVLRPAFSSEERFKKWMPYIVIFSLLLSVAFLVYVIIISGDPSIDPHNLESGIENACAFLGCALAVVFTYFVEAKFINFDTKGSWYAQIIKLVLGMVIVVIIRSTLEAPLVALFGNESVAQVVRHFLMVAFAGTVWPLTFGYFSKLRVEPLDKFTDKIKIKVNSLKSK